MSTWISIEEKLPNDECFVLALSNHSYYDNYEKFDIAEFDNGAFWRRDLHGFVRLIEITHWMPLPSLPGENDE